MQYQRLFLWFLFAYLYNFLFKKIIGNYSDKKHSFILIKRQKNSYLYLMLQITTFYSIYYFIKLAKIAF